MKCPKCQYIGFGAASRCRNCGYDFSFSPETQPLDLPIQRNDEPIGPLGDLPLTERPRGRAPQLDDVLPSAERAAGSSRREAVSRLDLPLFTAGGPGDDAPLVTPPAVPRPPLAVRRAQQPASRTPAPPTPVRDALEFDLRGSPATAAESFTSPADFAPQTTAASGGDATTASPFSRLVAGMIDVLLLGSIDLAVVYFTLRLCGLTFGDVLLLPAVPLVAFLLMLNGGYLVIFTAAGGQTIGKMTTGIRVVGHRDHEDDRGVRFGSAIVRAAAYFPSLLPAGLGFAPVLFTRERRALHDRLSETRVVKA